MFLFDLRVALDGGAVLQVAAPRNVNTTLCPDSCRLPGPVLKSLPGSPAPPCRDGGRSPNPTPGAQLLAELLRRSSQARPDYVMVHDEGISGSNDLAYSSESWHPGFTSGGRSLMAFRRRRRSAAVGPMPVGLPDSPGLVRGPVMQPIS